MNTPWTKQDLDLLDEILDQLIPANPEKGIPSAGVFGVGEFIASRAADNDAIFAALNELLTSAAALGGSVDANLVRQLETQSSEKFIVLVRLTYMGYYSRPEIRSLVGVAPWPVHPKGYAVPVESAQLLEQLTAPVKARGRCYRKTKDSEPVQPA